MAGTIGVMFNVGASVNRTVGGAFATVGSKVKGLKAEISQLNRQSNSASRLMTAQTLLKNVQGKYTADPTEEMKNAVKTAAREFKNAKREADQYGISIKNVAQAQTALTNRVEATRTALGRQVQLQANQAKRRELQNDILGTVGMAMTVAAPIKVAIAYEADFADLKKVADFASAEQEKQVQQDIFNVSRRTGIDASGMTKIAASAGEAGVVNDEAGNLDADKLRQFLNDAAEMAVAYGISAEEAGDRLAAYQSRMGLSAEQTRAMGDSMNYVASKMNATAADTSSVVARMGGVAIMAGLSEKSTAGIAAALVSTSENKEAAGTAMKSFLLTLSQGNAMSKQQKAAFKQIGMDNVQEIAEGMKKGGPEAENIIMSVLAAIKDMPEAEQAGIAKEIFQQESMASLAPLINDLGILKKALGLANSPEAAGSQLREFKTRSETTAGAIERLKASTGILGITVGSVLLPAVANTAEIFTAIVTPVSKFATTCPLVTQGIMTVVVGLIALKASAMAGGYAATVFSDGWNIARGAINFLRPSVIATNALLARQKIVAFASAAASGAVAVGAKLAAAGQWILNAAMTANPIGLVITGLSALGVWFAWCCEKTGSFTGALGMMWDQFKTVVPIMHVVESAVVGAVQFVSDLLNGVSLYEAGAKLMGTLGDGIMSMWETVIAPFQTVAGWIGIVTDDADEMAYAPASRVAEVSPAMQPVVEPSISRLGGMGRATLPPAVQPATTADTAWGSRSRPNATTKTVFEKTSAEKTSANKTASATNPVVEPIQTAAAQARKSAKTTDAPPATIQPTLPPQRRDAGTPQAPAMPGVSVAMSFTMNGIPDGEFGGMVIAAIKQRQSEFQTLISNIVGEQRRLAYGAK